MVTKTTKPARQYENLNTLETATRTSDRVRARETRNGVVVAG
jgi:hypothetical protein